MVKHPRLANISQSPAGLIKPIMLVIFASLGNIPQSLLSYKALAILWPYIEYVKIMSFILHYKNIYCSPLFADGDATHNKKNDTSS